MISPPTICQDNLTQPQIIDFLREHLDDMRAVTPPESVHALDLDGLRSQTVTFWSVWSGKDLLGCGALKELDADSGEIKSMRTAKAYRRQGIAAQMLGHIIQVARQRGYTRLYLETGSQPAFAPARALYQRYGFAYRGPFASYTEDPNSVFVMKQL